MFKRFLIPAGVALSLLTACMTEERVLTVNEENLFDSLRYPGIAALEKSLKTGVNPNVRDLAGTTPLIRASVLQRTDLMEVLLKKGADPNAVDADGETAMHAAAASKLPDVASLLFAHGGKIDVPGKNKRTPLMEAARLGRVKTVKYLLEHGADVELLDERMAGVVAYAAAARENGPEIIRLLIAKKAPMELSPVADEVSPLLVAMTFGTRETADFLIDLIPSFRPVEIQPDGLEAVRIAIHFDDLETVRKIVRKGLPLNRSISTVFKAAKFINVGGVHKFLARNGLTDKGYTPLMWAALYGRPGIAAYLVSMGADPEVRSEEGQNSFHYANDTATASAIKKAWSEVQNTKKMQKK